MVADLEDTNPIDLPPLYERIDGLISTPFSDPPPAKAQARIEFTYEGYRVLIQQDGHATFMQIE